MDAISATMITFGAVLLLASWVQLLISAFAEDYNWGLTTLFLPPVAYFYGLFSWQKAGGALLCAGLGWVLVLLALV
ncbi:hypothetical protein [Teredinibacter waterburyi]|jgi:hypothetical protein|uniref:hypothetical protein n=1 Tax=Teredinibacter waterburyi TaxID=1500538 RepID=UPI00165FFD62|nr:hypothetical protein [Teredinibacter waterburyi]